MTVEEIIAELSERSLGIGVQPDGTPFLRGPKAQQTPGIIAVLKAYRKEILSWIGEHPERAMRWTPKREPELRRDPDPVQPAEISAPPAEEIVENPTPRWVPHPGMKQESLDYWKAVMAQPLPPAWMMTVPDEPVKDDADENA